MKIIKPVHIEGFYCVSFFGSNDQAAINLPNKSITDLFRTAYIYKLKLELEMRYHF